MANLENNEVNFTFKGVDYILRPSFACLLEISDRAGEELLEILDKVRIKRVITVKAMVAVLYGGILGSGTRLNFEEFGQEIIKDGIIKGNNKYSGIAIEFLIKCLNGKVEKKSEEKPEEK